MLIYWPHIVEIANLVIKVDRLKQDKIFSACSSYKLQIECRKDLNEASFK